VYVAAAGPLSHCHLFSVAVKAQGIGHRASGIGHRASGIGHRASGIGHRAECDRGVLGSGMCDVRSRSTHPGISLSISLSGSQQSAGSSSHGYESE
jgi:hypothetical protein